jgi:hypothetical protein
LVRYFDLGFDGEGKQAVPTTTSRKDATSDTVITLPLGGRPGRSTWAWSVGAWLSLSCGIFLRQGLNLQEMDWQVQRLNAGSALAALVVGLAVLPPAMRWFNRKRKKPGAAQMLAAFSLGFLLDLASVASINPGAWLKFG